MSYHGCSPSSAEATHGHLIRRITLIHTQNHTTPWYDMYMFMHMQHAHAQATHVTCTRTRTGTCVCTCTWTCRYTCAHGSMIRRASRFNTVYMKRCTFDVCPSYACLCMCVDVLVLHVQGGGASLHHSIMVTLRQYYHVDDQELIEIKPGKWFPKWQVTRWNITQARTSQHVGHATCVYACYHPCVVLCCMHRIGR